MPSATVHSGNGITNRSIAAAAVAAAIPFVPILMTRRRRAGPTPGAIAALLPSTQQRTNRPERATSPRLVRVTVIALVLGTGGLALSIVHRPAGAARITVLDVGQGDAILVEGSRGSRMLVDGGPDPDRLLVELDRRVPPWDRRIDLLVLTHPHEDHVAGLALLLGRYRIGRVYEGGMRGPGPGYAAWAARLAAASAPARATLSTGARIDLDDIGLKVLWPDAGTVPSEPPDAGRGINDVSIVLLGEIAGRRFLLTGDVEDDVDPMLEARGLPPIDILKVAHHGSGTASTPAFLGIVRPRLAVVSSGAGNPYGHPARTTIEHLRSAGARVLRTDTDGSVDVTIDASGGISVATSGARRAATIPPPASVRIAAVGPRRPPPTLAFGCGIPSGG
jgi:competence protein ComEC